MCLPLQGEEGRDRGPRLLDVQPLHPLRLAGVRGTVLSQVHTQYTHCPHSAPLHPLRLAGVRGPVLSQVHTQYTH